LTTDSGERVVHWRGHGASHLRLFEGQPLAARSTANIRLEMKGSILPWSSRMLSLFERCIPSFTGAHCTSRTHESLTVGSAHPPQSCVRNESSLMNSAPTWRHAGVTGPAGRDRPQRTPARGVRGRTQPGAQSYADEILLKLNMTTWNATIIGCWSCGMPSWFRCAEPWQQWARTEEDGKATMSAGPLVRIWTDCAGPKADLPYSFRALGLSVPV
jgi:hypothetical protein